MEVREEKYTKKEGELGQIKEEELDPEAF